MSFSNFSQTASQPPQFPSTSGPQSFYSTPGGAPGMIPGMPPVVLQWQPSPEEYPIYESLFQRADKTRSGAIQGRDAAEFLKTSGLDKAILREVWRLSDYAARSYLDRQGFFVALRFIAMAQQGLEVTAESFNMHLNTSLSPPRLGIDSMHSSAERPSSRGSVGSATSSNSITGDLSKWRILDQDIPKYENHFRNLEKDRDGFISREKAKEFFLLSKLSQDIVERILMLCDLDKDNRLDKDEFVLGMHIVVCVSKRGMQLPNSIPSFLIPPSKKQLQILNPEIEHCQHTFSGAITESVTHTNTTDTLTLHNDSQFGNTSLIQNQDPSDKLLDLIGSMPSTSPEPSKNTFSIPNQAASSLNNVSAPLNVDPIPITVAKPVPTNKTQNKYVIVNYPPVNSDSEVKTLKSIL